MVTMSSNRFSSPATELDHSYQQRMDNVPTYLRSFGSLSRHSRRQTFLSKPLATVQISAKKLSKARTHTDSIYCQLFQLQYTWPWPSHMHCMHCPATQGFFSSAQQPEIPLLYARITCPVYMHPFSRFSKLSELGPRRMLSD